VCDNIPFPLSHGYTRVSPLNRAKRTRPLSVGTGRFSQLPPDCVVQCPGIDIIEIIFILIW